MKIVRTASFLKSLKKLGATEDDLKRLEEELAANPEAGDVIKGTGGVRKIRFSLAGKGKRGGGRAIYVVVRADDALFLLLAYSKSKQADLSRNQLEMVCALVKEMKHGEEAQ